MRRDELQVIDDDQVEALFLLLEPTQLGAHLGKRDARGIVDPERGSIEFA